MRTARILDLAALILCALCIAGCHRNVVTTAPQSPSPPTLGQHPAEWHSVDVAFRVLDITSAGDSFWICGTEETIAVSNDNGAHWQIKHHTPGGPSLSHIDFANSKFGYSAGNRRSAPDDSRWRRILGGTSWIERNNLANFLR